MRVSSRLHPASWALLLALSPVVLAVGCASVDQAAFNQFASSLQSLRNGSDTEAAAAVDVSRQDLLQKVADGEVPFAGLQLQFDASDPYSTTYGFAESEPNYPRILRFRQGLSALNGSMIDYAQSLVVLAGGGAGGDILPNQAQFDQMAQDLNANASTAANALGAQLDPGRQALLSAAAIELFKAYLEHKRQKDLTAAIREVQPNVEAFATAAEQAIELIASMVQTEYNEQVLSLATAQSPDARSVLDLNDATQARLAVLKSLSSSYGALPGAHRDLAAAASRRQGGLAGIVALGNEAIRLQGLVNQLTAANTAANTAQAAQEGGSQ